jgi:hypothetical protein
MHAHALFVMKLVIAVEMKANVAAAFDHLSPPLGARPSRIEPLTGGVMPEDVEDEPLQSTRWLCVGAHPVGRIRFVRHP